MCMQIRSQLFLLVGNAYPMLSWSVVLILFISPLDMPVMSGLLESFIESLPLENDLASLFMDTFLTGIQRMLITLSFFTQTFILFANNHSCRGWHTHRYTTESGLSYGTNVSCGFDEVSQCSLSLGFWLSLAGFTDSKIYALWNESWSDHANVYRLWCECKF